MWCERWVSAFEVLFSDNGVNEALARFDFAEVKTGFLKGVDLGAFFMEPSLDGLMLLFDEKFSPRADRLDVDFGVACVLWRLIIRPFARFLRASIALTPVDDGFFSDFGAAGVGALSSKMVSEKMLLGFLPCSGKEDNIVRQRPTSDRKGPKRPPISFVIVTL